MSSTISSRGKHASLCFCFCQMMYFKKNRLATWGSHSLVYFFSANSLLSADTFTKHPLILSFKLNRMNSDQAQARVPGLCAENVAGREGNLSTRHMVMPGRHLLDSLLQFSSLSKGPGGCKGIPASENHRKVCVHATSSGKPSHIKGHPSLSKVNTSPWSL